MAKSKKELHNLLTVKDGLYLQPEDQANMEFISDIFFNENKESIQPIISYNMINQSFAFRGCESMLDASCF